MFKKVLLYCACLLVFIGIGIEDSAWRSMQHLAALSHTVAADSVMWAFSGFVLIGLGVALFVVIKRGAQNRSLDW